jgi:hypothetical protein
MRLVFDDKQSVYAPFCDVESRVFPAGTAYPGLVAPNCTLDRGHSRYLHKEVSNSGGKARKSPAEAAVAAGTASQRFQ